MKKYILFLSLISCSGNDKENAQKLREEKLNQELDKVKTVDPIDKNTKYKLAEGEIEDLTNRVCRKDKSKDLEQIKKIIKEIFEGQEISFSGEKNVDFKKGSINLSAQTRSTDGIVVKLDGDILKLDGFPVKLEKI